MKRRKFIKQISLIAGGVISAPILSKRFEAKAITIPKNKPLPYLWKSTDVTISWIGHSTTLINLFGTIILTDPVFFQRIGLYFWGITYGPSRYSSPALFIDEIPKPDLVLLSHAHMDHTDYASLAAITDKYPGQIDCITAYNTKDVTEDLKWKSMKELDWNDIWEYEGIKIRTLEVKHFGWRYPWERDRSKGFFKNGRSYNAYILEKDGKKIMFGGDTAFSDKFKIAHDENVDIAIMPIGAYNPWHMNHCNPEEALEMAKDVNAKVFIPIHCKTFRQGIEPIEEPLERIARSLPKYNFELGIKEIGETYILNV